MPSPIRIYKIGICLCLSSCLPHQWKCLFPTTSYFLYYWVWGLNPWPKICAQHGIWTHDQHKISLDWTFKPFEPIKWPNWKNAAPPEMAGVPLPTCSGERAIHDPQEGLTVHFLHPVPYSKKGKLNYINSNFNVKNWINNYQNRFCNPICTRNYSSLPLHFQTNWLIIKQQR